MTEEDEKTINEMIGYFLPCWHNAPQRSEAKKRFARYIDMLMRLSPKENDWINVKDMMPEIDREVLVYARWKDEDDCHLDKNVIAICNRYLLRVYPTSPGYEEWSSPWEYFHSNYEITHWMPLPEPPEVEDAMR